MVLRSKRNFNGGGSVWWSGAGTTGGNVTNVSDPGGSGGSQQNNQTGQNNQNQGNNNPREQGIVKSVQASQSQAAANAVAASNQQLYGNKFQEYDTSDPMAFGFGSVFGASSGTTGSSKGVQDSIRVMVNNEIDKLSDWDKGDPQKVQAAADKAFDNFYPTLLDQEGNVTGTWTDAQGDVVGSGNRMLDVGWEDWQGKPVSMYDTHDDIANMAAQQHLTSWYSGGGGGGGSGGWGGGYGGGGAGGGGGYYGPQPGHTPEQMAGFYTPQANLQQAMVNVHGTPTVFKKRGGIVSLLRLS